MLLNFNKNRWTKDLHLQVLTSPNTIYISNSVQLRLYSYLYSIKYGVDGAVGFCGEAEGKQ